jgi:hypothetical protein
MIDASPRSHQMRSPNRPVQLDVFIRHGRTLLLAAACVVLVASPALAVSERDVVALAQAGLSDDVLVALVESDDTVFPLDAPRILELRREGLSERVIVAMLKNGRRTAPRTAVPTDAPGEPRVADDPPSLVIIGEKPAPAPTMVQETNVVVVPWIPLLTVPAARHPSAAPTLPGYRGFGRFINDGWVEGRSPSGVH